MNPETPSTAEEAFIAEILRDSGKLLLRLEELDKTLAEQIRKAIEEGTGKALAAANFRYEAMLGEGEKKIKEAARKAADSVSNRLQDKIIAMKQANSAMYRSSGGLIFTVAATSLIAGVVGGLIAHMIK